MSHSSLISLIGSIFVCIAAFILVRYFAYILTPEFTKKSESEIAQEFIHNIVEIDTACTMQYIEKTGNDAISSGRLTPDLAHLLSSAFYTGVFEVVIHGMAKKDAQRYIQSMSHFYNAGWNTIFNGIKGE